MHIHEKIKLKRKEQGLSQQQLADKLDMHITHLSRIENGHLQPSLDVVKRLINIFEVSADYLLNDDVDTFDINIENKSLAERIQLIDKLEEKDRDALMQVIDSMLTKQKMREVLNQQPQI
jgi:transcriptional regulator with XRE-family HTH domain